MESLRLIIGRYIAGGDDKIINQKVENNFQAADLVQQLCHHLFTSAFGGGGALAKPARLLASTPSAAPDVNDDGVQDGRGGGPIDSRVCHTGESTPGWRHRVPTTVCLPTP